MLTFVLGILLLIVLYLVATSDPGFPGSGTPIPAPVRAFRAPPRPTSSRRR